MIKLGIIGTGIAARELHLPAIRQLKKKFSIQHVCNHTLHKAKTYSELSGCKKISADYQDVLADTEVDAIVTALPFELNYPLVRDSLAAGKHIFIEKPLADTLENAGRILKLKERYPDRIVFVGENYRYQPALLKIKELLDSGIIGNVYAIDVSIISRLTADNKYAKTGWRKNHSYKGGFLTDGGVHFVALIRLLCGDITEVHSQTQSVNKDIGELDTLASTFKTDKDIIGSFRYMFSAVGRSEKYVRLYGSEGTLDFDFEEIRISGTVDKKIPAPYTRGIVEEFTFFHDCLARGEDSEPQLWQAYKDLDVMLKMVE